jgi:hypothetical protein
MYSKLIARAFALSLVVPLYQLATIEQCRADVDDLVQKFAPLLLHPGDEPNLPADVEWFLAKTTLSFVNGSCPADNKDIGPASLTALETSTVISQCGGHKFSSSGSYNRSKQKTFVLSDLSGDGKRGLSDSSKWTTYYHTFKNDLGGWNIQYWSFYAFNTGVKIGPIEIGSHGGDWEMVEVMLDASDQPVEVHTTGHTKIESVGWGSVQTSGGHPIMFTEKGAHEAHSTPQSPPPFISHPTWSGGKVIFPGQAPSDPGKLVDLGSKLQPKVQFLLYSGLWGSIGAMGISSGYWGPVFNETGRGADGFFSAWCDHIEDPQRHALSGLRECYADDPV